MNEVWKPIIGYEGYYSVSNNGRIRRELSKTCAKSGNILKPFINIWGYCQISLFKNGKRSVPTIHSIVINVFEGKRPKGMTINHKNGNKKDNSLPNLEYSSYSDNIRHSYRTGLRKNKLTYKDALNIRKKYATGNYTQKELSLKYGIAAPNISLIISNKKWKSDGKT